MGKKPLFALTWNDPEEAWEVAEVLKSAALDNKGHVRDHGFMRDAQDLFDQIEEYRNVE